MSGNISGTDVTGGVQPTPQKDPFQQLQGRFVDIQHRYDLSQISDPSSALAAQLRNEASLVCRQAVHSRHVNDVVTFLEKSEHPLMREVLGELALRGAVMSPAEVRSEAVVEKFEALYWAAVVSRINRSSSDRTPCCSYVLAQTVLDTLASKVYDRKASGGINTQAAREFAQAIGVMERWSDLEQQRGFMKPLFDAHAVALLGALSVATELNDLYGLRCVEFIALSSPHGESGTAQAVQSQCVPTLRRLSNEKRFHDNRFAIDGKLGGALRALARSDSRPLADAALQEHCDSLAMGREARSSDVAKRLLREFFSEDDIRSGEFSEQRSFIADYAIKHRDQFEWGEFCAPLIVHLARGGEETQEVRSELWNALLTSQVMGLERGIEEAFIAECKVGTPSAALVRDVLERHKSTINNLSSSKDVWRTLAATSKRIKAEGRDPDNVGPTIREFVLTMCNNEKSRAHFRYIAGSQTYEALRANHTTRAERLAEKMPWR